MTASLPLNKIFTPTGYPTVTYVDRNDAGVERSIRNAFETEGTVVSISGPSKSGKSVLVKKIVGDDKLIQVSGGAIASVDALWDTIFARLGIEIALTTTREKSNTDGYKAGITIGIPKVISVETVADNSLRYNKSIESQLYSSKVDLIVAALSDTDMVLFLDDYHYMTRHLQIVVAKQIKYAAEKNVKFCIASVPHRSDDVVRSNPELRGRTVNIDTNFWELGELAKIATLGFPLANLIISSDEKVKLASEACGSPQIMQALCL